MKFDKIYVGRGIAAPTPVRRTTHLGEDTGDTFARILQEVKNRPLYLVACENPARTAAKEQCDD